MLPSVSVHLQESDQPDKIPFVVAENRLILDQRFCFSFESLLTSLLLHPWSLELESKNYLFLFHTIYNDLGTMDALYSVIHEQIQSLQHQVQRLPLDPMERIQTGFYYFALSPDNKLDLVTGQHQISPHTCHGQILSDVFKSRPAVQYLSEWPLVCLCLEIQINSWDTLSGTERTETKRINWFFSMVQDTSMQWIEYISDPSKVIRVPEVLQQHVAKAQTEVIGFLVPIQDYFQDLIQLLRCCHKISHSLAVQSSNSTLRIARFEKELQQLKRENQHLSQAAFDQDCSTGYKMYVQDLETRIKDLERYNSYLETEVSLFQGEYSLGLYDLDQTESSTSTMTSHSGLDMDLIEQVSFQTRPPMDETKIHELRLKLREMTKSAQFFRSRAKKTTEPEFIKSESYIHGIEGQLQVLKEALHSKTCYIKELEKTNQFLLNNAAEIQDKRKEEEKILAKQQLKASRISNTFAQLHNAMNEQTETQTQRMARITEMVQEASAVVQAVDKSKLESTKARLKILLSEMTQKLQEKDQIIDFSLLQNDLDKSQPSNIRQSWISNDDLVIQYNNLKERYDELEAQLEQLRTEQAMTTRTEQPASAPSSSKSSLIRNLWDQLSGTKKQTIPEQVPIATLDFSNDSLVHVSNISVDSSSIPDSSSYQTAQDIDSDYLYSVFQKSQQKAHDLEEKVIHLERMLEEYHQKFQKDAASRLELEQQKIELTKNLNEQELVFNRQFHEAEELRKQVQELKSQLEDRQHTMQLMTREMTDTAFLADKMQKAFEQEQEKALQQAERIQELLIQQHKSTYQKQDHNTDTATQVDDQMLEHLNEKLMEMEGLLHRRGLECDKLFTKMQEAFKKLEESKQVLSAKELELQELQQVLEESQTANDSHKALLANQTENANYYKQEWQQLILEQEKMQALVSKMFNAVAKDHQEPNLELETVHQQNASLKRRLGNYSKLVQDMRQEIEDQHLVKFFEQEHSKVQELVHYYESKSPKPSPISPKTIQSPNLSNIPTNLGSRDQTKNQSPLRTQPVVSQHSSTSTTPTRTLKRKPAVLFEKISLEDFEDSSDRVSLASVSVLSFEDDLLISRHQFESKLIGSHYNHILSQLQMIQPIDQLERCLMATLVPLDRELSQIERKHNQFKTRISKMKEQIALLEQESSHDELLRLYRQNIIQLVVQRDELLIACQRPLQYVHELVDKETSTSVGVVNRTAQTDPFEDQQGLKAENLRQMSIIRQLRQELEMQTPAMNYVEMFTKLKERIERQMHEISMLEAALLQKQPMRPASEFSNASSQQSQSLLEYQLLEQKRTVAQLRIENQQLAYKLTRR
ncbi:hypothetical protein EDD86DRAFT_198063 [Gorgonomyces haynaldii]|nr:hypothetical protein EDD86DRAFT_198063 [Gorgonomyces haynaldii]